MLNCLMLNLPIISHLFLIYLSIIQELLKFFKYVKLKFDENVKVK